MAIRARSFMAVRKRTGSPVAARPAGPNAVHIVHPLRWSHQRQELRAKRFGASHHSPSQPRRNGTNHEKKGHMEKEHASEHRKLNTISCSFFLHLSLPTAKQPPSVAFGTSHFWSLLPLASWVMRRGSPPDPAVPSAAQAGRPAVVGEHPGGVGEEPGPETTSATSEDLGVLKRRC